MTWRVVARLTHLSAPAQRRLWRALLAGWALVLLACWAALSALTRAQEKQFEQTGQTYMAVAPLAAEVMDLRALRGQFEDVPPLQAAERVAKSQGIGPERLRLAPLSATGASLFAPLAGGNETASDEGLKMDASGLNLRELAGLLRDLRLQAGLQTVSADIFRRPDNDKLVDLHLVLRH